METATAVTSGEFEELMQCGNCKQKFNDTDFSPKLLACKHYFCLQCMRTALNKGQELYCVHCWKRTELGELGPEALPTYAPVLCLTKNFAQLKVSPLGSNGGGGGVKITDKLGPPNVIAAPQTQQAAPGPGNVNQMSVLPQPSGVQLQQQQPSPPQPQQQKQLISENCHTHAMPLALWCQTCALSVCRACASTSDHTTHQIKSLNEAKEQLLSDLQLETNAMGKMLVEVQRLAMQQREFLLKILEACVTLKTHVEADLTNNASVLELNEIREMLAKVRLSMTRAESLHDVQQLHGAVCMEKQRMQARFQEMVLQCQLDDLIRNAGVVFDFPLLKQALGSIQNGEMPYPGNTRPMAAQQNPILFLANYCMSQLYSRHVVTKQLNGTIDYHNHNSIQQQHTSSTAPQLSQLAQQQQQQSQPLQQTHPSLAGNTPNFLGHQLLMQQQQPPQQQQHQQLAHHHHHHQHHSQQQQSLAQLQKQHQPLYDNMILPPGMMHSPHAMPRTPLNMCPLYYFNIEVNGTPMGRVVIEVRADVAPKMAKNFGLLVTGETGAGCYKGCTIFQCWEGESVITGDFELNNGRGGRSIFEEAFFLPDDTKLMAVRGTVGMRRTQKRHDNLGMVGSQFRVVLQEMRGFTGIFGHVVEGLELVEKISTYGDQAGKPTKCVVIVKCGKL